jgi:hypothetical protein
LVNVDHSTIKSKALQKEMKATVKRELKLLASNHPYIKGWQQMEINELIEELNIPGFEYENDFWREVTISWLMNGKRTGVTFTIDTTDDEINEDRF